MLSLRTSSRLLSDRCVRPGYRAQRAVDATATEKALPLEEDRRLTWGNGLLRLVERESHSIVDREHRRCNVAGPMTDLNP